MTASDADRPALDPADVLKRIERARVARRRKYYLRDDRITLSHGGGGKATHNLIEGVFAEAFANPLLDPLDDSAIIAITPNGADDGAPPRLAFTTDSYVVSPLFFPGGDIGSLAVHGTVNDLAVAGADPMHLSAAFILEEGLPIDELRRIVASMAAAAAAAGVTIVTGDTKVVERGKADRVYINTAGIGRVYAPGMISAALAQPGDRILLSGPIGDHGIAIMMAREALEIEVDIESDSAPIHTMVRAVIDAVGVGVHCLKDPTRGGIATCLNEIAVTSNVAVAIDEGRIPIHPGVRGACEILGLDPLTIANEGKLVAVVAPESADAALEAMRSAPGGEQAVIIGEVVAEPEGMVFLRTDIGGKRVLDMLVGDPLPRIC